MASSSTASVGVASIAVASVTVAPVTVAMWQLSLWNLSLCQLSLLHLSQFHPSQRHLSLRRLSLWHLSSCQPSQWHLSLWHLLAGRRPSLAWPARGPPFPSGHDTCPWGVVVRALPCMGGQCLHTQRAGRSEQSRSAVTCPCFRTRDYTAASPGTSTPRRPGATWSLHVPWRRCLGVAAAQLALTHTMAGLCIDGLSQREPCTRSRRRGASQPPGVLLIQLDSRMFCTSHVFHATSACCGAGCLSYRRRTASIRSATKPLAWRSPPQR